MKLSSSHSEQHLLSPLFGAAAVDEQVSDEALLRAMLDAERALAGAGADVGVVPTAAADEIGGAAAGDLGPLNEQQAGNPVVPLVRALGEGLPEDARPWLHYGATSQDILDTALMLCVTRAVQAFESPEDACADLVRAYRRTPMAARTLGQQAGPTTFGLKAAGWALALDTACGGLEDLWPAAQLAGPAGTLDGIGPDVLRRYCELLGLEEPVLPWHTDRTRIGEIAGALGIACGAIAKAAGDVVLLAQTEVGELREAAPGGSSSMPHKRNPVAAISARACARQAPGLVATLLACMEQEHERAAGAWHAEWAPLRALLVATGSAASWLRACLAGLEVDAERMRANLPAGASAPDSAAALVDAALSARAGA